jgi:hypothetical protein
MGNETNRFHLNRRELFRTTFAGSLALATTPASRVVPVPPAVDAARCTASQVRTQFGVFGIENLALSLQDFGITGEIANHTDRRWRWASFLMRMRDENGSVIAHDDRFDGYLYLKNIGSGETRSITSVDGSPPRLLLLPSKRPASFEIEFIPERSYFDSTCFYSLVHPTISNELSYEDHTLRIGFTMTQKELRFTLANRLPEPMTIDWERVVYVDLSGGKHRVIHKGVLLRDKDKKQEPTRVAAEATLDEFVYPADLVAGSRVFEDWRLNPVMPLSQDAFAYRWRTFALILPLQFSGKTEPYLFTIRVENFTTA